MCRAFLTFTGHQKSIRVQETKILKVRQYFRPHQQHIQFYLERDWKFCSVCSFDSEQAQSSGTETLSRWQHQMLHLPLAATQSSRPTWNAIHMPSTEHCRATEISHDLFVSSSLNVAKGPDMEGVSREFLASLWDIGSKLLPFCHHPAYRWHWPLGEQKFKVLTGSPSFPQGWLLGWWSIFCLKDNKTLSRKINPISRKHKDSSKSGITDLQTFGKIWKFISLHKCYSFQFFLYSFWLNYLQDYCSFIFAW